MSDIAYEGAPVLIEMPPEAFNIFALALPHGPNYGGGKLISAWSDAKGLGFGGVVKMPDGQFTIVILCRREDFVLIPAAYGFYADEKKAQAHLRRYLPAGGKRPHVPRGEVRRKHLLDTGNKEICAAFRELSTTVKFRGALHVICELYLALPKPDKNFLTDLQTRGFNARIWELYLFACFKEQGCRVSQDWPSPDFRICTEKHEAYVEAVTTNPAGPGILGLQETQFPPADPWERIAGDMAARFAKTLRSKIQRKYDELDHVRGSPFALAVADFSGGATMTWSRESLMVYLYGLAPDINAVSQGKQVAAVAVTELKGHPHINAGLFLDPEMAGLSAIIFSNAGTLPKFQRMAIQAQMPPDVVKARRKGFLWDSKDGALTSIPFDLDTRSEQYRDLCEGRESWSFELEVFHNPLARHPLPLELLPDARHWHETDGILGISVRWKNQILSSVTELIIDTGDVRHRASE